MNSIMKIKFSTKRSINTPWGTCTPVLFSAPHRIHLSSFDWPHVGMVELRLG